MSRIGKRVRAALLAVFSVCDDIVITITGDYRPQRRKDYGVVLMFALLIRLAVATVAVITVCCLVTLVHTAFATHTLASCIVAGSILTVAVVMYAVGRLRRYVYERFEKGE